MSKFKKGIMFFGLVWLSVIVAKQVSLRVTMLPAILKV